MSVGKDNGHLDSNGRLQQGQKSPENYCIGAEITEYNFCFRKSKKLKIHFMKLYTKEEEETKTKKLKKMVKFSGKTHRGCERPEASSCSRC